MGKFHRMFVSFSEPLVERLALFTMAEFLPLQCLRPWGGCESYHLILVICTEHLQITGYMVISLKPD